MKAVDLTSQEFLHLVPVSLKIIMGLLKPDHGRAFVFGQEISALTEGELSEIRRRLGMVFQMGALFDSLTVEENVAFGLERHTDLDRDQRRQVVVEKLALVGLSGILDKLPSELSGGMRKRVSLARAIALEPELLLWDTILVVLVGALLFIGKSLDESATAVAAPPTAVFLMNCRRVPRPVCFSCAMLISPVISNKGEEVGSAMQNLHYNGPPPRKSKRMAKKVGFEQHFLFKVA